MIDKVAVVVQVSPNRATAFTGSASDQFSDGKDDVCFIHFQPHAREHLPHLH